MTRSQTALDAAEAGASFAAELYQTGDESKSVPPTGDARVIDPVDGTSTFVHERPLWTTTIAVVENGERSAGVRGAPALDDVYRVNSDGVPSNAL